MALRTLEDFAHFAVKKDFRYILLGQVKEVS
jgi:hypothetical protein